jgi:hypothetical protein
MDLTEMVKSEDSRRLALFLAGRLAKIVFALAIVLLVALVLAADHATALFFDGEKWVAHTHGVQIALAQLRTRMFQLRLPAWTMWLPAMMLRICGYRPVTSALFLVHISSPCNIASL